MTAEKSNSQKKQSCKEMYKHDAADEQMSVNSWICYCYKDTKWGKDSSVNEGAPLLGRLLEGQVLQYAM
jgi:hypothetical protein